MSTPLRSAAVPQGDSVTVDDLTTITHIQSWSVSPDGSHVAFLTVQAAPRRNMYSLTLLLQALGTPAQPALLARYLLPPEDVYYKEVPSLRKTASQYVWSPDSRSLLFTAHNDKGMALEAWDLRMQRQMTLLGDSERLEIDGPTHDSAGWKVKAFSHCEEAHREGALPVDRALHMKDGYMLYSPPGPLHAVTAVCVASWEYRWGDNAAKQVAGSARVDSQPHPAEMLKNGDVIAANESEDEQGTIIESASVRLEVEVGPEKTAVRIIKGSTSRNLYEDHAELRETNNAEDADTTRPTYMSADGRVAVLWRSSNLMPDELVKFDLLTGRMTALFSPNESFSRKTHDVRVRFIPIEIPDANCFGRLYLPADRPPEGHFPLVFTTYIASPGFDIGSGGEVPILPLVAHGVAVFSLEVHPVQGRNGDFATTHKRWEMPLAALQWVVRQLTLESIIDPQRVGVSGLSFGAEIAMYAYWKMESLRAVSAASDIGWTPSMYFMAGPTASLRNDDLGFPEPNDSTYKLWKTVDAGLNARALLPPLLWQTSDAERNAEIETWTRLRRAGANVEWLEYPEEGHVKRGPADQWWVNQRNLDWFLFWLKDEQDPDPIKTGQYTRWQDMRTRWNLARTASRITEEQP